jgi:hypothetical protein
MAHTGFLSAVLLASIMVAGQVGQRDVKALDRATDTARQETGSSLKYRLDPTGSELHAASVACNCVRVHGFPHNSARDDMWLPVCATTTLREVAHDSVDVCSNNGERPRL